MIVLFRPLGMIAGLLAGLLAKRIFDQAWKVVDAEDPPEPDVRNVPKLKLIVSLMLEGAIFAVVRGVVDHYARVAFARYTGRWPGEEPNI